MRAVEPGSSPALCFLHAHGIICMEFEKPPLAKVRPFRASMELSGIYACPPEVESIRKTRGESHGTGDMLGLLGEGRQMHQSWATVDEDRLGHFSVWDALLPR